jgi:3-deoxy-D-manno-octulosonate 8-phosphate phosphatase (KDO 8-P phosphatase)
MTDLAERCVPIELLVVDVDGVLTDGVIALDDRGVESKHFHVRDGSAINLWRRAGHRVALISGRSAPLVDLRAAELGISPVIQGATRKLEPFERLLRDFGLEPRQACYIGDDLADLAVLGVAGLAACPSDAAEEVRRSSHLVARVPGGRGAVREIIESILKHQGRWEVLVESVRVAG